MILEEYSPSRNVCNRVKYPLDVSAASAVAHPSSLISDWPSRSLIFKKNEGIGEKLERKITINFRRFVHFCSPARFFRCLDNGHSFGKHFHER